MRGYRPNAAVIVTDGRGRVLLCERNDRTRAIQTVQGGIDPGESARDAAEREMSEELGLSPGQFAIVDQLSQTYSYDFPFSAVLRRPFSRYKGQEQSFFLATVAPDATFALDADAVQEFSRVWWGTPQELLDGMWEPKRRGTRAALMAFGLLAGT